MLMPIIQPKIIVPDKIYSDYIAGNVEISGLAKNATNHKIVKHLDSYDSDDQSSASNIALGLGLVAFAAITAYATIRFISKKQQEKVNHFKAKLNAYIVAVENQQLTVELIDELIDSMNQLKHSTRKKITIQFSTEELASLINCLCNYTQTLAQANHMEIQKEYTAEENRDIILKLRKDLTIQKKILSLAA